MIQDNPWCIYWNKLATDESHKILLIDIDYDFNIHAKNLNNWIFA